MVCGDDLLVANLGEPSWLARFRCGAWQTLDAPPAAVVPLFAGDGGVCCPTFVRAAR
jgi:hypothetical protein